MILLIIARDFARKKCMQSDIQKLFNTDTRSTDLLISFPPTSKPGLGILRYQDRLLALSRDLDL